MQSHLSGTLRRTLLLKVLSKPQPSREDVEAIIELMAGRVIEALEAQSLTLYLMEKGKIAFKHVYFSNTLWEENPEDAETFGQRKAQLLEMTLPADTGVVGLVIRDAKPLLFNRSSDADAMHSLSAETGFPITSMLTVPLKDNTGAAFGAIQILNREPYADPADFQEMHIPLLEEVAEYSAPLILRMLDSHFSVDEKMTARFISRFTEMPLVTDIAEIPLDEKLMATVGESLIQRCQILPYKRISPNSVAVLMVNPMDHQGREFFQTTTEMTIEEVAVAPASLIESVIHSELKGGNDTPMANDAGMAELADMIGMEFGEDADVDGAQALDDEESAPIIQLANRIIEDAYLCGASDIHIEPLENELLLRYRVDGNLEEKLRLPQQVAGSLTARIKVMSSLDIAEKRLPQDGRIVFKKFTRKNIDIDLRVATAPMNFGEKVVMRILDKSRSAMPMTKLGFSEENLQQYRECIQQPYGMILHCGPTGSGKSMSLFSALREIARPEINIQTAEDPIEYTIPGINQMQVHSQIGLNFSRALRSYLRMDPDVILVGEIRDRETAEIAVEAALTGHLLLSTLHTNDAPSTIARITDMGIEPFMVSASLLIVCAQRLMRRVCQGCCEPYTPEGNEAEILSKALNGWMGEVQRSHATGCPKCGGNGYRGRIGIHELMPNSKELTKAINNGSETATIKEIAQRHGMHTLHQDSMLKVRHGHTTIIEALSTVPPDMI